MNLQSLIISNLARDNARLKNDEPHGWIQWKGTDVCIDLHCSCGYLGHYDGEFFYYYECPNCKKKYSVGSNVILHALSEPEVVIVEKETSGFRTCELEKD